MHIRFFYSLIILGFVAGSPVAAETNLQAAQKWGLLGDWKVNCSAPTKRGNQKSSFVGRKGKLFHDRDGGSYRDSHEIQRAVIKAGGIMEITMTFVSVSPSVTRIFAFVKDGKGRKRAIYNRDLISNKYVIKNGKFLHNGKLTKWQNRC